MYWNIPKNFGIPIPEYFGIFLNVQWFEWQSRTERFFSLVCIGSFTVLLQFGRVYTFIYRTKQTCAFTKHLSVAKKFS